MFNGLSLVKIPVAFSLCPQLDVFWAKKGEGREHRLTAKRRPANESLRLALAFSIRSMWFGVGENA